VIDGIRAYLRRHRVGRVADLIGSVDMHAGHAARPTKV
jgi:hypothetical protein